MNKIIFIGGIYPDFKMNEIKEKFGSLPQDAADLFQKNLISGLEEDICAPVTLFNTYFLPSSFLSFDRTEAYEWKGKYSTNYNLSYLRNRLFRFNSKTNAVVKAVSGYIENYCGNEPVNTVVYPAYYPFLKAVKILKKKYKLNVCLVIPDLPEFMGLDSHRTLYNKSVEHYSSYQFSRYISCVDSFVFLTENMKDVIDYGNKPYRIIEGIAPHDYNYSECRIENTKKNIVYSGKLQMKYGLDVYLKAIELIDDDINFDFYGMGEGEEIIKKASENDGRIRYMGYVLPDELHLIQQSATLLINPRQNDHEFTKYSFPSKTMEYMISGRPVIAYLLDGMPEEYSDYIISPANDNPESLAFTIKEYINKPEAQLSEIGIIAKEFVVKNKNAAVQAEKILELFSL